MKYILRRNIVSWGTCAATVALLLTLCVDQLDGQNRKRRGGGRSNANALKVGQEAPTFTLKSPDGKSETDLKSFRNKKPVVLLFGSYT